MPKTLTTFTCSQCGHESPKWLGRCAGCGEWNTLVEEVRERTTRRARVGRPVRALSDVALADSDRISTGMDEFDRVLGGGLVPGSLVLIGGEPGVGKSSLLLQSLGRIAAEMKTSKATIERIVRKAGGGPKPKPINYSI